MSSQELKKFINLLESIETEAMAPIQNEAMYDHNELSEMLDDLEAALGHAVDLASNLARYGREVPGPFSGQIQSYLLPHLESWMSDSRQPGSIPSLRRMLDEGEDDDYEN